MRKKSNITKILVFSAVLLALLFTTAFMPTIDASACCTCCKKLKCTNPNATIYVIHQSSDGILLKPQEVYTVKAGYYGPFWPEYFAGYGPGYLAPSSSPPYGTIKAGQSIAVIYYYDKVQALLGTIIVTHLDASNFGILKQDTYKVPAGLYGPYYPETFPGYGPGTLLPGSDLASGTIAPDGLKTIYFVYSKELVDPRYR
jgi:hypothetical protein